MTTSPELDCIDTVEKFEQITGGKPGTFFCTTPGCGRKFPHIKKLPNNGDDYHFTCKGCGQKKYVGAGIMAFLRILALQRGEY